MTGIVAAILIMGCSVDAQDSPKPVASYSEITKAKVTFVELGSVKCIPCKQMQPVMESIEAKYGDQIDIVFYDVWKSDQKHFAEQYKIRLIPTQVFLDINGAELMRHEGFFPETDIDAFLQSQGLTVKVNNPE
jgi:thioredoxin 1